MQNKRFRISDLGFLILATVVAWPAVAADVTMDDDAWAEEVSAAAVAQYQVEGSLFQRITDLEQEKVLMQLEKERAQLDLELDRLAAEKIKLHMEIDTLSGRAEEQQQAIEQERARLEAEAARLERERTSTSVRQETAAVRPAVQRETKTEEQPQEPISKKYRLVDIIGAGNQLQATVEDIEVGQRKKLSVGRSLDGYTIRSISLDDGVVFVKDDIVQTLNIGNEK